MPCLYQNNTSARHNSHDIILIDWQVRGQLELAGLNVVTSSVKCHKERVQEVESGGYST